MENKPTKTCQYDPDHSSPADYQCARCGIWLCTSCGYRVDKESYCNDCYDKLRDAVTETVLASVKIKKHLEGKTIKNIIYIPGKVLNIVTENHDDRQGIRN